MKIKHFKIIDFSSKIIINNELNVSRVMLKSKNYSCLNACIKIEIIENSFQPIFDID